MKSSYFNATPTAEAKGRIRYAVANMTRPILPRRSCPDPNQLDWSDDEGDYLVKPNPPLPFPSEYELEHDRTNQPNTTLSYQGEEYKKSKNFSGNAIIHPITYKNVLSEREKPVEIDHKFEIPLPYVPKHVEEMLGIEVVKQLWREFLNNGADETSLIRVKALK